MAANTAQGGNDVIIGGADGDILAGGAGDDGKVRKAISAQRGDGAGIPVRPTLDGGDSAAFLGALFDGEPGGDAT